MFTKLNPRASLTAAALSFAIMLIIAVSSQAADITIDGTQEFQIMNGFGVNANSERWVGNELVPALDTLIDTMGATVWRVVVESVQNWETTNDDSNPFNFNWTYYNSLYETEKFQKLWGMLGYLKQKNVDTIMVSVMGCLPNWMGGCSLNTSYEDEWVEMVTSLLGYARNTKNLRIDMFDPFNESDITNEGPTIGVTQYIRVLKKLITRMDALGLGDIEIIGPTTADVGTGRDWMQDMLSDSQIMGKVRHFGFHSYSGNSSGIDSDIKGSAYPDRNFWMTEFSAWCNGCDAGGQPPDDWTFGSDTFGYLRNHINQGAASALIWEGYDSKYEHPPGTWSYWGLLQYNKSSGTYTPRKRMYINAHVFRFVRPGDVRIGAITGQSGLTLLAFRNAATDSLTIVGRNETSSALTINGTLTGLLPLTNLQFYETTQSVNFRRNADVPVSNNTFAAQVAGNSFFTLSTLQATSDTTPPTTPSKLTATPISSSQINLSWGASKDNVGVTGYQVERCQGEGCSNFALIITVTGTTHNDTGLSASTRYTYRVRATDMGNNFSSYSNTASAVSGCEATALLTQGTIGTEIVFDGLSPCFGTKKGKVLIGDVATKKAIPAKITKDGWTDPKITCTVTKVPLPAGANDVTIISKEIASIALPGSFTVEPPEVVSISSNTGAQESEITIAGYFFSTKKGKVYLRYTDKSGKDKLKTCKVTSWTMISTTGVSEIKFVVPKLVPGVYPLSISNKVGTAVAGNFTIN